MRGNIALGMTWVVLLVACSGAAPGNLFPASTNNAQDAAAPTSEPPTTASPDDASSPSADPVDATLPPVEVDAAVADSASVAPADAAADASTLSVCAECGADGAPPYFAAQYVSQSFPLASSPLTMTEGQTIPSYIELQNVGTTPWASSTELATTQPRDRASAFADSTWLSPSRAAAVTGTIAPGASYTFSFDLHAPNTPGTYYEYFGLVDHTIWFGDPGQGGPPDNDLEVQIVVVAP
ncbi:MAG: NBR1-Ig-like domain-containing protein [Polyangiaceae bacterium]|jgi:hypothetical protein